MSANALAMFMTSKLTCVQNILYCTVSIADYCTLHHTFPFPEPYMIAQFMDRKFGIFDQFKTLSCGTMFYDLRLLAGHIHASLIPKHLSLGKKPGRNPYSLRFNRAMTMPPSMTRKESPSAAPSKPAGPAGSPEPVRIFFTMEAPKIPTTAR